MDVLAELELTYSNCSLFKVNALWIRGETNNQYSDVFTCKAKVVCRVCLSCTADWSRSGYLALCIQTTYCKMKENTTS